MVGLYHLPTLLQRSVFFYKTKASPTVRELEVYWSTVAVCASVNIVCTGLNLVSLFDYTQERYRSIFSLLTLPLVVAVSLIEIVSIFIIVTVKNFKLPVSTCCFSNRYMRRVIHAIAICNILWFLHRMGCNLLVAIFFIALAPARTMAALVLIYSVLVCVTLCLAYVLQSIKHILTKSFKPVDCCKLF